MQAKVSASRSANAGVYTCVWSAHLCSSSTATAREDRPTAHGCNLLGEGRPHLHSCSVLAIFIKRLARSRCRSYSASERTAGKKESQEKRRRKPGGRGTTVGASGPATMVCFCPNVPFRRVHLTNTSCLSWARFGGCFQAGVFGEDSCRRSSGSPTDLQGPVLSLPLSFPGSWCCSPPCI